MKPAESGFRIQASVKAGEVSIATGGREPAVNLEDLRFDGDVEYELFHYSPRGRV